MSKSNDWRNLCPVKDISLGEKKLNILCTLSEHVLKDMGRIICIALLLYPLNLFPLVYISFWVKTKKMEKLNFYLHLISSKYQSICIQLEVKICKFLLIWICRMQKEDCLRLNVLSKSKWDPIDIDDFFFFFLRNMILMI